MSDSITLSITKENLVKENTVSGIVVSEENIEKIIDELRHLANWGEDAVFSFKGLGWVERQRKNPYYIKKFNLDK